MKKSMVVWVTDEMEMDKLMLRFGITEDDVEASETYLDGSIRYAISVEESKIPEIKEYQAMKLMVNEKVIQAVTKAKKSNSQMEELMEWMTEQIENAEAEGLMEWVTEQIEKYGSKGSEQPARSH